MAALLASDNESDFGYDFSAEEEALLIELAGATSPAPPSASAATGAGNSFTSASLPSTASVIDLVPGKTESVAGDDVAVDALRARELALSRGEDVGGELLAAVEQPRSRTLPPDAALPESVEYPNLSRALSELEPTQPESNAAAPVEDGRTPLQRFRSYPRRPLTVTDLTSGAWCELQYWYTLTRLPGGRRTRTPAMREGSKLHQKLEDEVHTTVRVDITSKEDGFGLRLWNLVQGLRTLRDTGLTREMEIWGMVDGNLVNGVIDSLSHENPNPGFEEELSSQSSQQDQRQSAVTDYFSPKTRSTTAKAKAEKKKVYLADVKTRGSLVRVSTVLLRPAKIQLLLYHRFLADMAAGRLDFMAVLGRYGLNADEPFTDTFIAQIGALHDEIFVDASSTLDPQPDLPATTDSTAQQSIPSPGASEPDLLKYKTLRELLELVKEEIKLTFPDGEDSLGHMLRVQYIYRADGRELDVHDFPVSKQVLDAYMSRYMPWWHGERNAKGVVIEEAFKCRTCEFAADCDWRSGMDEERVKRARGKMAHATQATQAKK